MLAIHNANPLFTLTTPSDRELVLTREFDAPARLVFEAWTTPAHVLRWWACPTLEMPVCEIDLRVGGTYRFVTRSSDGQEYPICGEYREIVAPERLVYTQFFDREPYASHKTIITVTFVEQHGKTLLTSASLYPSAAARDGHLATGMASGLSEAMDRIASIVRTLGSRA